MPASVSKCPPAPPPGSPAPTPKPAPIPSTPAPNWQGKSFAAASGRWWWPSREFSLVTGPPVGEANGYGTWGDAVSAARELSAIRRCSVGVFDHEGRLYLNALQVNRWFGLLSPANYRLGMRGETRLSFVDDTIRGVIDGERLLSRGDCLDQVVSIPKPVASWGLLR